jgi:hypothetical protein
MNNFLIFFFIMTVTWLVGTDMGDNKIDDAKYAVKLLAISITMGMGQCNTGHIFQCSTSRASLEATGCRHRVSVCAILPWRQPWLAILVENAKCKQKTIFS